MIKMYENIIKNTAIINGGVLLLAGSLATGLIIEFGPKELKKPMEEIHVLGIYYLIGFIVLHWSGLLIAEFTDQKGIMSGIISGSKKEN